MSGFSLAEDVARWLSLSNFGFRFCSLPLFTNVSVNVHRYLGFYVSWIVFRFLFEISLKLFESDKQLIQELHICKSIITVLILMISTHAFVLCSQRNDSVRRRCFLCCIYRLSLLISVN